MALASGSFLWSFLLVWVFLITDIGLVLDVLAYKSHSLLIFLHSQNRAGTYKQAIL